MKILPSLFNISLHILFFFFFFPLHSHATNTIIEIWHQMPTEIILTMLFWGNIFIIMMMNVYIYRGKLTT